LEAASVVLDRDHDPLWRKLHIHADAGRAGVAVDVAQGFLGDATERDFHLGRQPPDRSLDAKLRLSRSAVGDVGYQPLQGGNETEVVEQRGSEIPAELAELVQCRRRQVSKPCQFTALCRCLELGYFVQATTEDRQLLGGPVVQLTGDVLPLFLHQSRLASWRCTGSARGPGVACTKRPLSKVAGRRARDALGRRQLGRLA
jgi:hypothetical protein